MPINTTAPARDHDTATTKMGEKDLHKCNEALMEVPAKEGEASSKSEMKSGAATSQAGQAQSFQQSSTRSEAVTTTTSSSAGAPSTRQFSSQSQTFSASSAQPASQQPTQQFGLQSQASASTASTTQHSAQQFGQQAQPPLASQQFGQQAQPSQASKDFEKKDYTSTTQFGSAHQFSQQGSTMPQSSAPKDFEKKDFEKKDYTSTTQFGLQASGSSSYQRTSTDADKKFADVSTKVADAAGKASSTLERKAENATEEGAGLLSRATAAISDAAASVKNAVAGVFSGSTPAESASSGTCDLTAMAERERKKTETDRKQTERKEDNSSSEQCSEDLRRQMGGGESSVSRCEDRHDVRAGVQRTPAERAERGETLISGDERLRETERVYIRERQNEVRDEESERRRLSDEAHRDLSSRPHMDAEVRRDGRVEVAPSTSTAPSRHEAALERERDADVRCNMAPTFENG